MKKSLLKNNLKTIKKTRRRFISILIMAFLGVGFFAGLVASSPDMLDSLDNYADNNNLYDISILSTLGFTDEDIEKIGEIDGIENVCGVQTKDSLTKIDGKESICKVIEYNEKINTPAIIAGRNIENENECLLDSAIIRTGKGAENYIGKKIVLENTDTNADDNPTFKIKEFEIVGIIETPIYISTERGNTSIGNGTVSFYIFTKDSAIDLDYYTGAYVTVKNAKETVTNSTEYLELVNPVIDKLEEIKQEREEKRYTNLVNEIKKHIYDNIREYAIVSILFLIGLILGVIFINNANETQIMQITEYLNNFSNSLKTNYKIDNMELIKNSIKDNVILTIIMWFAGSTIIGLPIVFGIVSFRGFCMGYTISSAVATFGIGKGAIFATCSLLMQNIIFVPALLALAVTGIKVYKSIIKDKRRENIKFEIIRHTLFSVIILILLVISAVVETYISPNLLKMVINYI